jgi:hypothetical protein
MITAIDKMTNNKNTVIKTYSKEKRAKGEKWRKWDKP